MTIIHDYELERYRNAAQQMCYRFGEPPHEMVMNNSGAWQSRWSVYAIEMFKHELMIQYMRNSGLQV